MRRILVYGVTGSGKTTLARRLGEQWGLPYHAIDDLAWEPGWVPVPDEVQRDRVREICAGESWVIDGAYQKWAEIPLERVDLIVGLDLPRWRSFGRLLRRTAGNIVFHRPLCNGNYETWRGSVFGRDSIVRFHFGSFARKRARMRAWQAHPEMPRTILLRTPREVERFVRSGAGEL